MRPECLIFAAFSIAATSYGIPQNVRKTNPFFNGDFKRKSGSGHDTGVSESHNLLETNPFLNGQIVIGGSHNTVSNNNGNSHKTLLETNPFLSGRINVGDGHNGSRESFGHNTGVTASKFNSEPSCGVKLQGSVELIIGGEVAQNEYPWLAALYHFEKKVWVYKCSSNLITRRHVITAAHCTKIRPSHLQVVLGTNNLDNLRHSLSLRITKVQSHPDYTENNASHDLAVLTLEKEVDFPPVCLWRSDWSDGLEFLIKNGGFVAGWGSPKHGESYSKKLKWIKLAVVSRGDCLDSNPEFFYLTSKYTFCAGKRDQRGPCKGDSGAGFIMNIRGTIHIRGLVSMSLAKNQSCDLDNYVVFSDFAKHSEWIRDAVKR